MVTEDQISDRKPSKRQRQPQPFIKVTMDAVDCTITSLVFPERALRSEGL
jgi:hypothetical protein